MKKKSVSKSPLVDSPLRNPGQWLDEEINRVFDEKISINVLYIVSLIVFDLFVWIQYLSPSSSNPLVFTLIAIVAIGLFSYRLFKATQLMKRLKLARDGEIAVGQSLEELRVLGYGVLHDVLGENFNLDHVIFSANGIFVIETKTFSKPVDGPAIVSYDGQDILVNGRPVTRNPIIQAKAAAHWLSKLLEKSTGKKYPVRGVVVFPGWFVEPSPTLKKTGIWVLNPKALPAFIANEPKLLKDDEVHMAIYHVSRYVRIKSSE